MQHRRTVLTILGGCIALAGCVSETNTSSDPTLSPSASDRASSPSPRKQEEMPTANQVTADGVTASYRFDSRSPTENTITATFGDEQVTVRGSIDPVSCQSLELTSVGFDSGQVSLGIRENLPGGQTETVGCTNVSYDILCVVTVDEGRPRALKVTYKRPNHADLVLTDERD
jgi:hypothetical protein